METITEAQAERIASHQVRNRLSRDAAYKNAGTLEEQDAREDEIAAEVWDGIMQRYMVTG